MNEKLSERLAEMCRTPDGEDLPDHAEPWGMDVETVRKCIALARRVEGAAKAIGSKDACTDECASIIMHIGNGGRAKDARGKWFHLVPVEGGA